MAGRRRSSALGSGSYVAFTRTWYRREYSPYTGTRIVPGPGRKTTRAQNLSYDEALRFCKNWNATHKPGPLSRKCEFTEASNLRGRR